VDKGVKAVAFIKQRYDTYSCIAASIVADFFRAAAIMIVMNFVLQATKGQTSLCLQSQAAVAVWLAEALPAIEGAFYAQRPIGFIAVNVAYSLGTALIAATSLFFIKF
jgi:hypothetical protein